jgi:hypothetical protein
MPEILQLKPGESLTVVESSEERLVVEAEYAAGDPPPAHVHPSQDERFEVLSGRLRVVIGGSERTLLTGDVLEIPRGTAHKMWSETGARARWETTPAGRTLSWWRALDAVQRSGRVGKNGLPSLPVMAALLTEYDDVFRLAAGGAVVRPALRLLAPFGRRAVAA